MQRNQEGKSQPFLQHTAGSPAPAAQLLCASQRGACSAEMPGVSGAKVILGAEYINKRLLASTAARLGLQEMFVFVSVTRQQGTRRLCSGGRTAGDGKY